MNVETFSTIISQSLPEPHAGLLTGMLFGTKTVLDSDLKQAMVATGTIHITALSGMNISIIVSFVVATLSSVFSKRATSLLTVLIIIGFIYFVGPSASVVRAGIMGSIVLVTSIIGKQRNIFFILLVTTILMLFFHPGYISDLGFQLSVSATVGICLFAQQKSKTKKISEFSSFGRSIFMFIAEELRTSFSAQIFTVPIIAFYFHRISVISPFVNVFFGCFVGPITIIGMLLCLVGLVYLPLAQPFAWVEYVLLEYVVRVITFAASLPFVEIHI